MDIENKFPLQTKGFKDITDSMYSLHKEKMAGYGPSNMLGTGELGALVRLWDKMARLMNLMGYTITISKSEYKPPADIDSAPCNESIDDTLIDLANYAVIFQLLRRGVWGK